jgi:amidohydrolase
MLDREELQTAAAAHRGELEAIRQDIHAHPETAFEEHRTAALVAADLRRLGIEVTEGIGRTGVVGTIRGERPGQRAIALRADMDALNILEGTGLPYASSVPGKMHACGHDGHTTMLLGAARLLAERRERFGGTVHLIFQPAEEGQGGAKVMIEDGLFERFPCDAVYGLHNKPGISFGKFSIRKGPMLAASDTWTVTFKGKGGHGGSGAHLTADLSVVAAHFLLGLQTIVGRNVPSVEPAVLSLGHIHGGSPGAPNVMPAEILLVGTARSYAPSVRDILEGRLGELATGLAAAHGATAEVHYQRRYPPMINHGAQVDLAADVAGALVGDERVQRAMAPGTGAEDFAYMLERKPGAFMFLGAGDGDGQPFANLHSPLYDFDDRLIPLGVAYWVALVDAELGDGPPER